MLEYSTIVAAYASVPFYAAYVLPLRWAVVRLILGYASLVLFGVSLLGFFVPEVAEQAAQALNNGVKDVWKMME